MCNSHLTLFPPKSNPGTSVLAQTLTLSQTPGPQPPPWPPDLQSHPLQSVSTQASDPPLPSPAYCSAVAPYCPPDNLSHPASLHTPITSSRKPPWSSSHRPPRTHTSSAAQQGLQAGSGAGQLLFQPRPWHLSADWLWATPRSRHLGSII